MTNQEKEQTYSLKCAVNSFISTYISGAMHPLDVIKTRYQSHDGKSRAQNLVPKYNGIINALKTIYQEQGFKGLFKGYHVSMFSQAGVMAIFFWMYQLRKIHYLKENQPQMWAVIYSSLEGGIFATTITQPLWVIKTRMLLNTKPNLNDLENLIYSCRQIYAQHGLRGYGTGYNISLILSFSVVMQMYTYEFLKTVYDSVDIPQSIFSQKNFICGALSKFISVIVTYPLTTIRTRAQQNQYVKDQKTKKYKGNLQIIKQTLKGEGLHGFYKGFQINLVRGILQRGVYFYCYQLFKKYVFGRYEHVHQPPTQHVD